MTEPLRIGTRKSKLALVQTDRVVKGLEAVGIPCEVVPISTKGDWESEKNLQEFGDSGIFVHELDRAILEGRIDAAVHSMKDLPSDRPSGLVISAVLKRDSPFDFIAVEKPLEDVFVIGTSSLRRRAQLLRYFHTYPEMHVSPIRGNIDTRIAKLQAGEYDAVVVAEAALIRLGCRVHGFRLPADAFVPSPNQGAIAVVSREGLEGTFAHLNHEETAFATAVERAVLEEVGGGCILPFGAYSQGGRILAEVLSLDGKRAVRVESEVPSLEAAHAIGRELRRKASDLIEDARKSIDGT